MFQFFRQKNKSSLVRTWAENQKRVNGNEKSIKILSDAIIYGLCSFCSPRTRDENDNLVTKADNKFRASYGGDTCLFEVGCYLYLNIDVWHFEKYKNKHPTTVVDYLINEFLLVFEKFLEIDCLNEIYQNRIDFYSTFVKESDNPKERIAFYLSQLLIRAKNNARLQMHNFQDFPVIIVDAFEKFFLDTEIQAFEVAIIPACLITIAKYYALHENQSEFG